MKLKIGQKIYIANLTDGIMKVDRGFVYGEIPKPDRRNRVPLSAAVCKLIEGKGSADRE